MDMHPGAQAKEEGIKRAGRSANPLWRLEMYGFGLESAREKLEITADDPRDKHDERGKYTTRTNNAMASIMRELARDGVIEDTGRVTKSRRIGRHRGLLHVWRSKIFGGSS
jgi:hypothetical protein